MALPCHSKEDLPHRDFIWKLIAQDSNFVGRLPFFHLIWSGGELFRLWGQCDVYGCVMLIFSDEYGSCRRTWSRTPLVTWLYVGLRLARRCGYRALLPPGLLFWWFNTRRDGYWRRKYPLLATLYQYSKGDGNFRKSWDSCIWNLLGEQDRKIGELVFDIYPQR